jgi:hypothetical protein
MRKRRRGPRGLSTSALIVLVLLSLPACILIVSSGPTTVAGATIVFVAVDDDGWVVAALSVTVVDVQGDWREHGLTAGDGSFSCGVRPGVTRVRAEVSAPAGYVLADPRTWPRELEVSPGGSLQVEVRVKSGG